MGRELTPGDRHSAYLKPLRDIQTDPMTIIRVRNKLRRRTAFVLESKATKCHTVKCNSDPTIARPSMKTMVHSHQGLHLRSYGLWPLCLALVFDSLQDTRHCYSHSARTRCPYIGTIPHAGSCTPGRLPATGQPVRHSTGCIPMQQDNLIASGRPSLQ